MILRFAIAMTAAVLFSANESVKTFNVKKIQHELKITGKGDDPLWKEANELTDFVYPWENEKAPFTSFKALHSKDWLYCIFYAKDENIITYVSKHDKTDALNSDRVEIFFKQEDNNGSYYCLEMDPLGQVYDNEAKFTKQFDPSWSWPRKDFVIKTSKTKDGYTVEVAISKSSLTSLGLLKNKTLNAGLYRAECIKLEGDKADFKWISWIRPDSKRPDFHVPSSFGVLALGD